jgi:dolichol-phosphate mannosyltransferase
MPTEPAVFSPPVSHDLTMPNRTDVCVLLPTLNEAETIGSVVDGFHDAGFEHVLVIDGNSSDGTRDVAAEHGARSIARTC